jgi:hypothetical protein
VRPLILLTNTADVIGNYFWADGVLFEEGTVVRSWTPGFVTSGVTFEGGGLNIDTSQGGKLRLKASTGGARDEISVGASGLVFGGSSSPVELYSGTANVLDVAGDVKASLGFSTPANGKTAVELTSQSTDTGLTLGTDTTLYRSGAGALKTDGSFTASSLTATAAVVASTTVTATTGLTVTNGGITMNATTQDITLANGGKVVFGGEEIGRSATGTIGTDSDFETTGMMFAANIASGIISVTPVANTNTGVAVIGLSVLCSAATATSANFSVLVTANSSATATQNTSFSDPSFSGSTMTGFSARILRSNTVSTSLNWLVIGR